jgi:hypothetical protein
VIHVEIDEDGWNAFMPLCDDLSLQQMYRPLFCSFLDVNDGLP